MSPPVAYVTTADGVRIACTKHGRGRPLIHMPPIPFRHVELEWESPEDRRWLERLAARHRLVQYDPRGMGLSERAVDDFALHAFLLDLEAVVASLAPEPVALFAAVNTGPLAIAYAVRHPERVSHLVLWCTSPRADEAMSPYLDTLVGLAGRDWDLASETVAHVVRGWSAGDTARKLAALLRAAIAPDTLQRLAAEHLRVDVGDLLPQVATPTLVLHRREVSWLPLASATALAQRIPGARLALFEGASMAPWANDMEAVARAIDDFLGVKSIDEVAPASGDAFRREGEYWTLSFGGRVCRIRDAKGLHHLAALLRQPGQTIPAAELLAAGTSLTPLGDAGPTLDARAKTAYRDRLQSLGAELDEAERFNDAGRAEAAREEIAAVTQQLAAAVGLGGRDRPTGSAGERARLTATKRIRDAVQRIRRAHPTLGEHLAASVRTGLLCSYEPATPVRWSF